MDAISDAPRAGSNGAKVALPHFSVAAKLLLAIKVLQELVKVASIFTAEALHGLFPRIMTSVYLGYVLVFFRACVGGFATDCEPSSKLATSAVIDAQQSDLCISQPTSEVLIDNVSTSSDSSTSEEGDEDLRTQTVEQSCSSDVLTQTSLGCADPEEFGRQISDELVHSHSELAVYPPAAHTGSYEDYNLVEPVEGLQGLKTSLAAKFASDPSALPASFRGGYIVDLDQHWISVHASFDESTRSLSLIVFDTLEVNFQEFHEVGLLRSSSAESAATPHFNREEDSIDVVTLCKMRGITYDIGFLTPVCDMRRLTWEEEEEIRMEKQRSKSTSPTIYYDQDGAPFRKIIVQPILQAERDGTCKSRALAVLVWLLRQDDQALRWYVLSTRELFEVELPAQRAPTGDPLGSGGRMQLTCGGECLGAGTTANEALFGSLMSNGRRDKFGRDVHLKVCHADTSQHNRKVEERSCIGVAAGDACDADADSREAMLPGVVNCNSSHEASLRRQRQAELRRIQEVLGFGLCQGVPSAVNAVGPADEGENAEFANASKFGSLQRWRAIADHEARWQFLEETCFFGHNLGFRKIKKLYSRDEVLEKETTSVRPMGTFTATESTGLDASSEEPYQGFGETKYLRKYFVANNYITHEADPMFNQPLENVLGFLCGISAQERVKVPFFVLPFPGCFVGLSLENYAEGSKFDLEVDGPSDDSHRSQRVSDYSLPSGNNFLNDPSSYNKSIANVSLPVKLAA